MIKREIPITVYRSVTGAHSHDGKDLREELQKSEYARVGFQTGSNWVSEMLTELIKAEQHSLKSGVKVRVIMEVVRTET